MCLSDKTYSNSEEYEKNITTGYKVFSINNGKLYPAFHSKEKVEYQLNNIWKENNPLSIDFDAGFHIMQYESEAYSLLMNSAANLTLGNFIILPVKLRKICHHGTMCIGGNSYDCYCGKELDITFNDDLIKIFEAKLKSVIQDNIPEFIINEIKKMDFDE